MRFLIIPVIFWIGFFILFWNIKKWNLPATKVILYALAAAIVSAAATAGVIFFLTTFFN